MGCSQSSNNIEDNGAPAKFRAHGSESFPQLYTLGDVLGKGAFSIVKSATHRQTRDTVAVKIISKSGLSQEDDDALKEVISFFFYDWNIAD